MFHFILPKFIFNIERWKWNNEYRVYVSNMGHFKDEHKNSLPFLISNGGYVVIKTSYGFKRAHRLVMLTWAPIPNAESLTVDHLDHNKRNNALSNLEWVTDEENQRRANRDSIKKHQEEDSKEIFCIEENRVFKSRNDVVEWLMNYKFHDLIITDKTKERMISRLDKAIKKNVTYGGYHWVIKE